MLHVYVCKCHYTNQKYILEYSVEYRYTGASVTAQRAFTYFSKTMVCSIQHEMDATRNHPAKKKVINLETSIIIVCRLMFSMMLFYYLEINVYRKRNLVRNGFSKLGLLRSHLYFSSFLKPYKKNLIYKRTPIYITGIIIYSSKKTSSNLTFTFIIMNRLVRF